MKKLQLLVFMLLTTAALMAQRAVTGTITDASGEALIGANIIVKGQTAVGTVTDIDGKYSLNMPAGADVIMVSYTGYATQEVTMGASNVMDVVLQEGIVLDEMVITALGISREEKSLGYAVQEISGVDLASARESNVINSLQGKVAGVQIQGSPSAIGGSSRITIRGSSSFLGDNQPLFVVDGVPISNQGFSTSSQERGFGGGAYDYGSMAQDINPDDVETMTVLKGSSATALYGTRGANGVIIITTKKGGNRKGFGVDVNSSVSFDQVTNLIPHQQEYGGGSIADTESGFNETIIDGNTVLYPSYGKDGSWGPKYGGQMVRHWDSWDPQASNFGELRPWQAPASGYEDFFETGVTLQNSVALSGSNDLGSFRLGYTNLDQEGTFPNAELQRNTISFNSDYKVHDRVKVGLSGNYIRTDAENRNATGYNNANPMQAFTQWWQTQLDFDRLKDASEWTDGRQGTWNTNGVIKNADTNEFIRYDSDPNFFDNPYWVRDNYLQEDNRNRFFGNAKVTINILEGLDFSSMFGTDFYSFSSREGIPRASVEPSKYAEVERRFQENNFENRLTYTKGFGDISFTGGVGTNIRKTTNKFTNVQSVGGIALENFFNIGNSAAPPLARGTFNEQEIRSVFAFASIGYKNWLYLDLSERIDWSSTIDPNNSDFDYPAVSLSAVITDIPGLDNLGPLSFAKARISWAQAGNDTGPYNIYDTFSPQTLQNGNPAFAVPNAKNNSELRNELTTEYEVGLDLRFFNNRLGLDAAYYSRSTKDQIFNVPVSAATGFTSRWLNAGEMKNSGFELMLTASPIKTKDFSWDLGVNFTTLNNEVVSLADGVESINMGTTWAADLRVAEGESYMAVYGQDFVRENFERDTDGNITKNSGKPTVDDEGKYVFTDERVALGSAIADFVGGFNTMFTFKGISVGALFDFQGGGIIHSTSLQWSKYSGMHPETVSLNGKDDIRETGMILDGVKADGTPNDIAIDPQGYYQSTWRVAAPNVYDASFIKLREISVGYTLPNRLLSNTTFRDVRIGLFGRNLAILASDLPYLDPQTITGTGNRQGLENAQIPSTRSFGVNLSFKL